MADPVNGDQLGENMFTTLGITDAAAQADYIKLGRAIANVIPADPITSPFIFDAACEVGDIVGDLVLVTGAVVRSMRHVRKVDITRFSEMPAVGMIVSKTDPITAQVANFGAVFLGGIIPNRTYFVGPNARITSTRPAGPAFIQEIGYGLDTNRVFIQPNRHMTKVL